MATAFSLHRYDLAALLSSIAILFFAYVIYPAHLVQISAWLTVFTIFLAWMGFFLHKLLFDADW